MCKCGRAPKVCGCPSEVKKEFKVGQVWLGRGGDKYRILRLDSPSQKPIVIQDECTGELMTLLGDGRNNYSYETKYDLVKEWKEPRKIFAKLYYYIRPDGCACITHVQHTTGWKLLGVKEVTITEGEGM